MKKVGILTFHDALNFGAVLQAYALQTFLSNQGNLDVEIIDYKPDNRPSFVSPKYISRNPIKLYAARLLYLYYSKSFKKRDARFLDFAANCHRLTDRKYTSIEDFEKYCNEFDILIAGSDQVFNPKPDSQIYYLGFNVNNCLRVAYAPSIGLSSISKEAEAMITPWVRKFDAISCREEEGARILSKITGSKVKVVCDPVCLLTKEQWNELAIHPTKSNYIFVYDLNGGESLFKLASKLSKQTGLPIVYSTFKTIHHYVKHCETHHDLGPKEWLGYISNASCVVTDSFHGTMLSLILETCVITKIASKSTASRLTSMMKKLGVQNQLIEDFTNFEFSKMRFNSYQHKLEAFVSESKEYLQSAIQVENH